MGLALEFPWWPRLASSLRPTMPPMRKPYTTDLTDVQWEILRPLIPDAKPGGRPREVDIREVMNTLLYQDRTGCQWEMLPHDLLPKSTVCDYFSGGATTAPGRGSSTPSARPSAARPAARRRPRWR